MAIFYDAEVAPDALTTFVREVPTPAGNALSEMFPVEYSDTNTFDFAEIVRTNRTAKYRAFDGAIAVTERDRFSEKRVPLAPLSLQIGVGEYERLQLEFARTGGTNRGALVNAIYNDGQNLTTYVLNRIELAWGDVLTDGKLTINENGFSQEADYGMPANHAVTPAGDDWTNANAATAVPLTDIEAWTDIFNATNGFRPATMLTSLTRIRALQRNKQVIDAARGSTGGHTRVTLDELQALLASEGFPTLRLPYDTQLDVDGTPTRVIAEDKVIFLPEDLSMLGHMQYGITATALELLDAAKTDMAFAEAPGIVGVVVKDDHPPFKKSTFVDAVGQPILTDARKLMVADVA